MNNEEWIIVYNWAMISVLTKSIQEQHRIILKNKYTMQTQKDITH